MTDEKDEKKDKKNTLSLNVSGKGNTPDISKILEERAKVQKGRTRVEIIGSKKASEVVDTNVGVDKSKKAPYDDTRTESKDSNLGGNLTSEERALRAKFAAENYDNSVAAQPSGLSSFKVVHKKYSDSQGITSATNLTGNSDLPVSLNTSDVDDNKTVQDVSSKFATSKKEATKDKDFEEDKKEKKKTIVVDQKRAKKNWKDAYAVGEEGEEEEDEEEQEEIKYEKETPLKFTQARRKNKRRKVLRDKIVRDIILDKPLSVKDLATKMTEKSSLVIKFLTKLSLEVKEDTIIDLETAELAINEFGHNLKIKDVEIIESQYFVFDDNPEDLKERPPVVTIMGHVDHGKTTLLDSIRKANIAAKEAGGITQHIGAYQIKTAEGKFITFLDTPGHEAFSQIRARGSKVTDIIVLVVAADDGVKPQTIEAISHAKLANVPVIVAINKIDKPDKNITRLKAELLQHNIVLEEMGGDILSVEISAKNNIGIDKLLELILLQSEVLDLKTNYNALGRGSVIEVKQEKGIGFLASVVVERGTLRLGDLFVCGRESGRIKVMINDKGERIKEALPSLPVEISGFSTTVDAGDSFIVVKNEIKANELIEYRKQNFVIVDKKDNAKSILEILASSMDEVKTLVLVIKADTQGSLEAIIGSLNKINHKEVEVKIIYHGVGEIAESDVMLAKAGGGIVIGFNSRANGKARDIAKKEGIDIRYHSIIYNLIDDIKLILSGLLDPNIVENIIGYAEVRDVFDVSKVGKIAGCYVRDGVLRKSSYVRVLRNNVVIHSGVLSHLKRFKDDVKEVKHDFECGASLSNYTDIRVGDMIECYEKTEVKNNLE